MTEDTRSVAWGDVDGDRYLDFAVGNYGQPDRVYRNNRDSTFSLVWTSSASSPTTSVAWADYDGDGDLDLAVGNYGESNLIYENDGGSLGTTPIWQSASRNRTTSLAWGDWDNDGDLDLAVGNDGQPDRVYANLNSRPGSPPQLFWIWAPAQSLQTTGLAWVDQDGDGDLDLAISQKGTAQNGVYENNLVLPAHQRSDFSATMPLPNNPSYVSVRRPGAGTGGAGGYSSARDLVRAQASNRDRRVQAVRPRWHARRRCAVESAWRQNPLDPLPVLVGWWGHVAGGHPHCRIRARHPLHAAGGAGYLPVGRGGR